ncbi:MAG: hypothetical protein HY260_20235 [Chloroflexi bacterium]|nr:hypothetical protein [Chloroflexota bacterium]
MVEIKIELDEVAVVNRNLELQTAFNNYIFANPDVLDRLPDRFRLVILPEDDPQLCWYNLDLLTKQGDQNKPVVIVRMRRGGQIDFAQSRPEVLVPLAV